MSKKNDKVVDIAAYARLREIENRLDDMAAANRTGSGDGGGIEQRLSRLESFIFEIGNRISKIEGAVEQLASRMNGADGRFAAIEARLNTLDNKLWILIVGIVMIFFKDPILAQVKDWLN